MTIFILFFIGIVSAYIIAANNGRVRLSVLISMIIWIVCFTIMNMSGGHFSEAFGMGFGMSWVQAMLSYIPASLGASLYKRNLKTDK